MNNKEVRNQIDAIIYSQLTRRSRKVEPSCEYKGHEDRFCRATTHETCKGCKFFSPNHAKRLELVLESLRSMKEEKDYAVLEKEYYSTCGTNVPWRNYV